MSKEDYIDATFYLTELELANLDDDLVIIYD